MSRLSLKARIGENPGLYGKTTTTEFTGGDQEIAPENSADFVLTFRNILNWMRAGTADAAFHAFYRALKPGGILGVEEHRGRPDPPQDPQAKSGYVRQDYAIALAGKAGFKLIGSSEVNANPKDTKDYPEGVWTLPPTYRLKEPKRNSRANESGTLRHGNRGHRDPRRPCHGFEPQQLVEPRPG
jgi:predicted methyltransferase